MIRRHAPPKMERACNFILSKSRISAIIEPETAQEMTLRTKTEKERIYDDVERTDPCLDDRAGG